jgi:hypothetical protein
VKVSSRHTEKIRKIRCRIAMNVAGCLRTDKRPFSGPKVT